MICPVCRGEYVEGVEACADCGVTLMPAEPDPGPAASSLRPPESEGPWVVLLETDRYIEAELAVSALGERRIPHFRAESDPSALNLDLPLAPGTGPGTWYVIHVPEAVAGEALSALERQPAPPEAPPPVSVPGPAEGPRRRLRALALATLVLFALFVLYGLVDLVRELLR